MLKNYFLTAISILLKNRLYSAINIIGLAIGLAACIVIALYVRDQYSYDRQWENSERIYRVDFSGNMPGKGPLRMPFAPLQAIPLLAQYFEKEIELSTRTFTNEAVIDTGISQFKEKHVRVDPAFIDMFQLEVSAGSLVNTLTNPTNIALRKEFATRCFGPRDPVGEVLTLTVGERTADYIVTAVYDIPGNTILDIPLLSRLDDADLSPQLKTWFNFCTASFLQLRDGMDIGDLSRLTSAFLDKNIDMSQVLPGADVPGSALMSIDFQNIETIHLETPWDTTRAGGNKTVVLSFAAISILVLLIGCINFIILTTAKATQRAKEVALRKTLGARRKQLIFQFLGESIFIVFMAVLLSLGFIELILPVFESIVGKSLALTYSSPSVISAFLVMVFAVGLLGGLYPAFVLSGFQPGHVLKSNRAKETKGAISIRNILVISQFSISIVLMIATCVIHVQMRYSLNRDPGYNKDNLLVINKIDSGHALRNRIAPLKKELLTIPHISDVCLSSIQPSQQMQRYSGYSHRGRSDNSYVIARTGVGYDYFTTYRIPLIAGRNYDIERDRPEKVFDLMTSAIDFSSDNTNVHNIIINESAARELGFPDAKEAVGKAIDSNNEKGLFHYTIIGVVADNHIFSINAPPRSETYPLEPDQSNVITVRFQGPPQKVLKEIGAIWDKVMGDAELSTVFVDQLLAQEFGQEQTAIKVLISFSLLAILIACMGLFGSASFTVDRRTKEIGLRKVMGARVNNIVALLLWQFSKPVLIANMIAWPAAVYAMQNWLERFPYRFNPLYLIPICLVSGFFAFIIAWSTVAGNTSRAARKNPVHSLRYE